MNSLTGVWKLVRLNLRRDRVKLPVVIIATLLLTAISMPALEDLYNTEEAQTLYASSAATSVAARVMGGPVDGASLGAITMVEMFLFNSVIIAFIAGTAVVRHTRQNEELLRTELIESYPVGRYAGLASAMIVACGAVLLIGIPFFGIVASTESLTVRGSLGMAAGLTGVGISFAFIAAILVQLTESARGANGYLALAVGAAFIIRGIGDGFGNVTPDGLAVKSEWPVWLSPIGWGQQTHPFTQENWAYLSFFFIFSLVAGAVGFYLMNKRDKGLAIFATRPGPSMASAFLKNNLALSLRLQKNVIIGWSLFFAIFGAFTGVMAKEFEGLFRDLFKQSEFAETFFGDLELGSFEDVFFSSMYLIFALVAAGYCVHALTKMRSEESNGHLEFIFASKANRYSWIFSHIFWMLFGLQLLFLAMATISGLSHAIISDAEFTKIFINIRSMFSLMPATLLIASVTVFIFGFLPRLTTILSWTFFAIVFFLFQFGELIKLPQMLLNISPFTHLPAIPVEAFKPLPFSLISLIALLFLVSGVMRFNRRDVNVV